MLCLSHSHPQLLPSFSPKQVILPKNPFSGEKKLLLRKRKWKIKTPWGSREPVWVIFGGNKAEDVVTFWRGIPWFNFWKYLCIKSDQNRGGFDLCLEFKPGRIPNSSTEKHQELFKPKPAFFMVSKFPPTGACAVSGLFLPTPGIASLPCVSALSLALSGVN